jgi:hypothetical protein
VKKPTKTETQKPRKNLRDAELAQIAGGSTREHVLL